MCYTKNIKIVSQTFQFSVTHQTMPPPPPPTSFLHNPMFSFCTIKKQTCNTHDHLTSRAAGYHEPCALTDSQLLCNTLCIQYPWGASLPGRGGQILRPLGQ